MPVNMITILVKLPCKMREQWRTQAHVIMETSNERAHFYDLVVFIERRVKILSDPLFDDLQDQSSNAVVGNNFTKFNSQPRDRVKGNVVATTVTSLALHEGDPEG